MDRVESAEAVTTDGIPYAAISSVTTRPRLVEIGARLRKAMSNAATGPLLVAAEVMAISEDWDSYEAEAEGLSCSAWLRKFLGRGHNLAFFEVRARAVEILGEDVRRWMHHDAAKWCANIVPVAHRSTVKAALYAAHKEAGATILSEAQTRPIVMRIIGRGHVRAKTCTRCQILERLLTENGIAVPKK